MNESEIFMAALDFDSEEERIAFLNRACGQDESLRKRIETLLASHKTASSLLEHPAVGLAKTELDTESDSAGSDTEDYLSFLEPSEAENSLGRIGEYEVTEVIGRGGMGIVLRAFDTRLQRVVAVKVLSPELLANATARKRFLREAQAAAAISHDHVVTIFAVEKNAATRKDDDSDISYLVMEYIDGQSLQEKIDRHGSLELKEILRIGRQVALGLSAAHEQGLIHRDIKPANILLQNGIQRVKITDFGLARAVDDVGVTMAGETTGTPLYMSPEQAQGQPVDSRSDLFSLGSVLYAMCTGRSPFRAETTVAVLRRVCDDQPRPIREVNPDIPTWLTELIDRLLEKNPDDRFRTASEVAELLGRHLAHLQDPRSTPFPGCLPPVRRRERLKNRYRKSLIVSAIVLLCLIGILGSTEATGVTNLRAMAVRIFTPQGTLVVETDDRNVRVTVEGDGGLIITGSGLEEIRLSPGSYRVLADKNGRRVPLERELVSISRGDREVVRVKLEARPVLGDERPMPSRTSGTSDSRRLEPVVGEPPEILKLVRRFAENDALWVNAIAYSPDGQSVVTSSPSGLDEWHAVNGKHLRRLEAPGAEMTAFGFLDEVACLAGITREGRLLGREWPSGEVRFDVEAHASQGMHCVLLPNSQIATTAHDGFIRIWDARTGSKLGEFSDSEPNERFGNLCLSISPDQHYLAVGGTRRIDIWDLREGKLVRHLPFQGYNVHCVPFSPDGRYLLAGGSTGLIQMYELDTGQIVRRFKKHTSVVLSLLYLPDGRHFVSGSLDGTLRVWALDGREIARQESTLNDVSALALAPDGRHVVSSGRNPVAYDNQIEPTSSTLQLWELPRSVWPTVAGEAPESLRLVRRFEKNDAPYIGAIQFAPDGKTALASSPRGIDVWDLDTGKRLRRIAIPGAELLSFCFTADEKRVLGVSWNGRLYALDWPSGEVIFDEVAHEPKGQACVLLAGSRIATIGYDGYIRVWDTQTGEKVSEFSHAGPWYSLAVSPDQRHLVASGPWRSLVLNAEDGEVTHTLPSRGNNIFAVAISPDGRFVLNGCNNGVIQLYELNSGELLQQFEGHTNTICSLEFLPNGRHFVSGSMDGTLRVWALGGQEVARQQSSQNDVSVVAIAPDGRHLLTAGRVRGGHPMPFLTDSTLTLWELPASVWGERNGEEPPTVDAVPAAGLSRVEHSDRFVPLAAERPPPTADQ